ncbi:MAG TPA: transcription elongation factor GreA [Candidatus Saccharimonadales bacterium]|nr:transcription elongation factor GreA [Candidatus Saccharimonadales bacterium]
MKKTFLLTKAGVAELEGERAQLIAERGPVADAIKTAREFGDLAENAEYQSARQEQEKLEARITEIEHILQNVQIITKPRGGTKVQIGSMVTLKNGQSMKFQVVGTVEADPLNGKISDESPIGKAILGKKLGERVEIGANGETATYKVTSIS